MNPTPILIPEGSIRSVGRRGANRLLGYPAEARLLILNADDLGICESVNDGIIGAIEGSMVCSTSLMTPCPGARDAMRLLQEYPRVALGVHLTIVCDSPRHSWGPLSPSKAVSSLVEGSGRFHDADYFAAHVSEARLDELEIEFRAQIAAVFAARLRPTHLDWHCLPGGGRPDVFKMTVALAAEYGLALRVHERSRIAELQARGLPTIDHPLLDSYRIDPVGKTARYVSMLCNLPAGLSEWAVHPGLGGADLRALEPDSWQVRQTDYEFLVSAEARETIEHEGIVLLNYEPLRKMWATGGCPLV